MKNVVNYKKILICFLLLIIFPMNVYAERGCCSHHGGVAGCSESGRQICNDGTLSPTCTCTPTVSYIYGCTDSTAKNYNSNANKSDGSCQYYIYGCTDPTAKNYNEEAEKDDGSCQYYIYGCTNEKAVNYNKEANKDDGSCQYYIYGCTNERAINYNLKANIDDGSCKYTQEENNYFATIIAIGVIIAIYYFYKKRKIKLTK